jgi:hypothetical protein
VAGYVAAKVEVQVENQDRAAEVENRWQNGKWTSGRSRGGLAKWQPGGSQKVKPQWKCRVAGAKWQRSQVPGGQQKPGVLLHAGNVEVQVDRWQVAGRWQPARSQVMHVSQQG